MARRAIPPASWLRRIDGTLTAFARLDFLPQGRPLAPWQTKAIEALPIPPDQYPAIVVGGNPTYRIVDGQRVRKVWYGADELAPTLVPGTSTAVGKAPSAKSMSGHRVLLSPTDVRLFTARLGARLQGFPDDYILPENEALGHILVGNSVPPPLAEAVCWSFLSAAARCPVKKTP